MLESDWVRLQRAVHGFAAHSNLSPEPQSRSSLKTRDFFGPRSPIEPHRIGGVFILDCVSE